MPDPVICFFAVAGKSVAGGSGKASTDCTLCPAGQYAAVTFVNSVAVSQECVTCPAGYFSAADRTSCTACPDGKTTTPGINTNSNSSFCFYCTSGTYLVTTAASSTLKYTPTYPSKTCGNCPGGTYSSLSGVTADNTVGKTTGFLTTPAIPAAPLVANFSAASSCCLFCAAGTYSGPGSSSCSTCPGGTYSGPGQSTCTQCAAGTFSTATGQTSSATCVKCAKDTFSAPGSTACTACPGIQSSLEGSASCSDGTVITVTLVLSGITIDKINSDPTFAKNLADEIIGAFAAKNKLDKKYVKVEFKAKSRRALHQAGGVIAVVTTTYPVSSFSTTQANANTAALVADIAKVLPAEVLSKYGITGIAASADGTVPVVTLTPAPQGKKKKSNAWIAGPVIGGVVGAILIGGLAWWIVKKKKANQSQTVAPKSDGDA